MIHKEIRHSSVPKWALWLAFLTYRPSVVLGDFNLTRLQRNKQSLFQPLPCQCFNNTLHDIGLEELNLLGKRFTWTDQQPNLILARLDWACSTLVIVWFSSLPPFQLFLGQLLTAPHSYPFLPPPPDIASSDSKDPGSIIPPTSNRFCWPGLRLPLVRMLLVCLQRVSSLPELPPRWSKCFRAAPSLIPNCKLIIKLLDYFEEECCLSQHELQVWLPCRDCLAAALKERATYWKERSKVRAISKGDARHPHGWVQWIHDHQPWWKSGCPYRFLQDRDWSDGFFKLELWCYWYFLWATNVIWFHDITFLWVGSQASSLKYECQQCSRFRWVWACFLQSGLGLNQAGSDGLHGFHVGSVDLARLNWSFMVLIPKKADSVVVDALRPICLQNCCIKLLLKIITTRHQCQMPSLKREGPSRRLSYMQLSLSKLVINKNFQLWLSS